MPHKGDEKKSKSKNSENDSDEKAESSENKDKTNSQECTDENSYKEENSSSSAKSSGSHPQASTWTTLPSDLENKILDLTGPIQCEAKTIRMEDPVDWSTYLKDNVIDQEEYDFLMAFQVAQSQEERDTLMKSFEDKAFPTFGKVVKKVTDIDDLRKILVVIDDMIWEDETRLDVGEAAPWQDFTHLLDSEDEFVRNLGSRIISVILSCSKELPNEDFVEHYLHWLKEGLQPDNNHLQTVARCLQRILRNHIYREAFMQISGVYHIVRVLSYKLITQSQYQLIFCLWITSLTPQLAEKMNRAGVIPVLAEILHSCPVEIIKIPRIIMATFRNLLELPREPAVSRHNSLVMIQCKIVQNLKLIENKINHCNDIECQEDFQFLTEVLDSYAKDINSIDEYRLEVLSQRLEWSDVHKEEEFWTENAERLNDNGFELIRILIEILQTSTDVVVLTIAAHDLEQYMRHYRKGRKIVDKLGGKEILAKLLVHHRHPKVREHCLKTLQVMMIDNQDLYSEFVKNPKYTLR